MSVPPGLNDDATTVDDVTGLQPAPLPEAPPPPGIGRYRLVARLGAGAMGVVWSATDPQLERKVAIKVVHPRLASSPDASIRMLREARAMAKLSHRAVVTVHDAGEVDGRLFLAMELIDGETLTARLRRPDLARPEAWRARLALVLEAGRGLAAAHAAGVLHRDFKPDNVLVDHAGRVAVGDFGLAALGETAGMRPSRAEIARAGFGGSLTMTGALLGTPAYMSPQQLEGEPADERGDQFAFCVTAFEALYGTKPFPVAERGLDALAALAAAATAGVLAEPPGATAVPAAVREVLRRGLAASPAARWPDMATLLAALDTASGLRARRGRRGVLVAATLGLVALAAGAGAYLNAGDRAPSRPPEKRPLYRVPGESVVALGPDGESIAVGFDHIDVHEKGRATPWTLALPAEAQRVFSLELDADTVHYATQMGGERKTWRFREASPPEPSVVLAPSLWVARFAEGDLYVNGHGPEMTQLSYVVHGQARVVWPFHFEDTHMIAVSPDRQKFVFVAESPSPLSHRVVVLTPDGRVHPYASRANLTAVAWLDDHTLALARNTLVNPSIFSIDLATPEPFVETTLYEQASGWFMRLVARDGRLIFVDGNPITRVRVFGGDATLPATHDYEAAKVAAELGWVGADELLVWNHTTHRVARTSEAGARRDTGIALASEPANATLSGNLLIVTLRSKDGRDVEAYDLTTGIRRWQIVGGLHAVRCTEDRGPPCVAILADSEGGELVALDPETGALGAVRAQVPVADDVAVRADGHLLVVGTFAGVRELDAAGLPVRTLGTALSTLRSVAIAADGSVVVAGTIHGTTYAVGRIVGGLYRPVVTTETELLLLARPSPDAKAIAVIGRTFSTELAELVRP